MKGKCKKIFILHFYCYIYTQIITEGMSKFILGQSPATLDTLLRCAGLSNMATEHRRALGTTLRKEGIASMGKITAKVIITEKSHPTKGKIHTMEFQPQFSIIPRIEKRKRERLRGTKLTKAQPVVTVLKETTKEIPVALYAGDTHGRIIERIKAYQSSIPKKPAPLQIW